MKVTPEAIDKTIALIEEFEGFRDKAYPDPGTGGKPWTIGFGTTMINNDPVQIGMTCTREDACQWVKDDLANSVTILEYLVTVDLNDNQAAACLDFIYNCGAGNFKTSTLLQKLNNGDYDGAANEFGKWNKGGGKVLPGLVRRRAAEKELFQT